MSTAPVPDHCLSPIFSKKNVGNDQEMTQPGRNSHTKNHGGKYLIGN